MKINVDSLNQDVRYVLNIDNNGHCGNEGYELSEGETPCDHEYNRCYRIDSISIQEPSQEDYNRLVELVLEDNDFEEDKQKVQAIFELAHSKFDLTDTSNYDWNASRDYYGDSLDYVKFQGSLLQFLSEELSILGKK